MKLNKVVTAMIAVVLFASLVLSSGSIGMSVDNDKLPGSDQAIGINYIEHTTLSTAITTTLTPARDLTGDWEGTCVYYWLDMWGERDVKITATCKMSLKQNGNVVTGTFDIYPTKYEDIGEAGYTPPIENHYRVNGIVSATTLTFDNSADRIGAIGGEQWKFTFTTDRLTGGVTNLDEYSYSGSDSDSNGFTLKRVSTPKQDTGFKFIDIFEEIIYIFLGMLGVEDEKTSSEWVEYGDSLYEMGDYSGAITAYDRALDIDPNDATTWYWKANSLDKLGRYEEAITAYDRALDIDPDNAIIWNNKGLTLYDLGRYEEALTAYDRAIAINPDHASPWNNKGYALYGLGRYEEAITAFERALEINPDHAYAWNGKGLALYELGRYEEALSAYDRAIAINPDYTNAKKNRDDCLSKLGKTTGYTGYSGTKDSTTTTAPIGQSELVKEFSVQVEDWGNHVLKMGEESVIAGQSLSCTASFQTSIKECRASSKYFSSWIYKNELELQRAGVDTQTTYDAIEQTLVTCDEMDAFCVELQNLPRY